MAWSELNDSGDMADWQMLLKGYITSKLLWNPDADAEALYREYIAAYYGPAAPYFDEFVKLFDGHFSRVKAVDGDFIAGMGKDDDYLMNAGYYPLELFEKAERLLDKAEEAVSGLGNADEKYLERIRNVRVTPMIMKAYNYYFYYNRAEYKLSDYLEKTEAVCLRGRAKYPGASRGEKTGLYSERETAEILKTLDKNPMAAWDVYRHIYHGYVGKYRMRAADSGLIK
jgi:hypothetical protein